MIRLVFRSAPTIGRLQGCVAIFRRTIRGEAKAHAKAKPESVQGQNRRTRNHNKATEPKIRGDVIKKLKVREEVIRAGDASLVDDLTHKAAKDNKATEPKIRGDVIKKPKVREKVIREGDAGLVDDLTHITAKGEEKESIVDSGCYEVVTDCCGRGPPW